MSTRHPRKSLLTLPLVLLCWSALAPADPPSGWTFHPYDEALKLAQQDQRRVFLYLDGAGRRHIAALQDHVAVAWEDDRTGSPQVYLAVKPDRADGFPAAQRLSAGEDAYEPALVAIDDGRWLAAWEQDGAIKPRLIDPSGSGPIAELAAKDSGQLNAFRQPTSEDGKPSQLGTGAMRVVLASAGNGLVRAVWLDKRNAS